MKKKVKISEIKNNTNNPRIIKDDKFKKLVKSIKEFPEMLEKRPIVVDETMMVLGGNMRLKACLEAGLKEVWIDVAEGWTEDQKQEFIVKDNVGFGEWDWDTLANEWDIEMLEDWGLDVWKSDIDLEDFSEKNKEIDFNDLDKNMVLKLNYSEDEYNKVKDALLKIAITPEQAVWFLLKL
jgi:ParB-like chromosome segregation protein Spo0J